jgi:SAM-dependent methyltransferase
MTDSNDPLERWEGGQQYGNFMGRWSLLVAPKFLAGLPAIVGSRWLDVGCGTGALTQTVLAQTAPSVVRGVDLSPAFLSYARVQTNDRRVSFAAGDAMALPFAPGRFDAVVSGLALNFVPQPERAVAEMARVARTGGIVAAYVWDYAGRMEFLRYLWDAAVALDPAARAFDEGLRFPICQPEPLRALFSNARMSDVRVEAIDVETYFPSFDAYWSPFLSGRFVAPVYVMSLSVEQRTRLRERLRQTLSIAPDGSIRLVARAWAVVGRA